MSTEIKIVLVIMTGWALSLALTYRLGRRRGYDFGWVDGWFESERWHKQKRDEQGRFVSKHAEKRPLAP